MSRTRTGRLAAAALLAVGTAVGAAAPAFAAIGPGDVNGKHPSEAGCRADQQTIYHKLLHDNAGNTIGYVDLMYSVHCHAAWAHAHSTRPNQGQTYVAHAKVERNDGKQSPTCGAALGSQDCWSTMVWDKDPYKARAWGQVDPNGASASPPFVATSWY